MLLIESDCMYLLCSDCLDMIPWIDNTMGSVVHAWFDSSVESVLTLFSSI